MNKDWHNIHPFPEEVSNEQKASWRMEHSENCNCGKMMLPYRQESRD
jgi:hypothetical protein